MKSAAVLGTVALPDLGLPDGVRGQATYHVDDDACEASQACCLPNGHCVSVSHIECVDFGGAPESSGATGQDVGLRV